MPTMMTTSLTGPAPSAEPTGSASPRLPKPIRMERRCMVQTGFEERTPATPLAASFARSTARRRERSFSSEPHLAPSLESVIAGTSVGPQRTHPFSPLLALFLTPPDRPGRYVAARQRQWMAVHILKFSGESRVLLCRSQTHDRSEPATSGLRLAPAYPGRPGGLHAARDRRTGWSPATFAPVSGAAGAAAGRLVA
jgi:hypothetical protein